MTEPKYKPIPFTAPMVRAILEGRKTQTRRIVKVQPPAEGYEIAQCVSAAESKQNVGKWLWVKKNDIGEIASLHATYFSKPYAVGDRLWVKETYCYHDDLARCLYKADGINSLKWNPSIHMPRWASRITLEITGVLVERLQDISGPDCWAEGIECAGWDSEKYGSVTHCYRDLWESINGPGAWDKNPWVWVIEFKRVGEK